LVNEIILYYDARSKKRQTILGCRIPKEHGSHLRYGGSLIHTNFFKNNRVWVYPRVNERMILESTTNCFMHRGGTRRNFVNT